MANVPTAQPDNELSSCAAHAIAKLSQRSPDNLARLRSFWVVIIYTLDHEDSFFLPVPTSQYEPRIYNRTTILQDTGALLALPEAFARHVMCKMESRLHNVPREDMSSERWQDVETLSARLAVQHPDHVTNVFRLWQKVLDVKGKELQGTTVNDLGLLFQLCYDEILIVMNRCAGGRV